MTVVRTYSCYPWHLHLILIIVRMRLDTSILVNFSTCNLVLHAVARALVAPALQRITFIAACGVCVSFYVAGLVPDCYQRQRRRLRMSSMGLFHLANFVYHVLPLPLMYTSPLPNMGLYAAMWHLGWGLAVSGGTLELSHQYVHLPIHDWYFLWSVAVAVEVLVFD